MKKKEIKFLPILLGSDENAYGCARLFFDTYGVKPLLICARPLPPTSYSRILTRRVIKDLDTPHVFIAVMEEVLPELKKVAETLLVIPCSDYYAALTVKNRAFISSYSKTPIISDTLYEKFYDKAAFFRLCTGRDLPHPETVISNAEKLSFTPIPFPFPVVIKPANSNSFSYLHLNMENRKKVYFCENTDELKALSAELSSAGYREPLVVQRYVSGARALTVNAYCDREARVRLIGAASPILEYSSPTLIGNYAALETVSERSVCERIAAFLHDIGYVGFANFDLKFDMRRGEYLFLELNPRQGRSSYCVHTAGKNLMKALVDDVIFSTPYLGTELAEDSGIWSNVSSFTLKKHVDASLLRGKRIDSAISPFYDFSPMRLCTLIRREYGSASLIR